jgi:hypothetical protein
VARAQGWEAVQEMPSCRACSAQCKGVNGHLKGAVMAAAVSWWSRRQVAAQVRPRVAAYVRARPQPLRAPSHAFDCIPAPCRDSLSSRSLPVSLAPLLACHPMWPSPPFRHASCTLSVPWHASHAAPCLTRARARSPCALHAHLMPNEELVRHSRCSLLRKLPHKMRELQSSHACTTYIYVRGRVSGAEQLSGFPSPLSAGCAVTHYQYNHFSSLFLFWGGAKISIELL